MSSKLTYAITCVLAGTSGSVAGAATPSADSGNAAGTDTLQEVVVTAQRRTENIQDVPISMQALTAQTLQQLNIATFDDYIKFLPNVTSASNGPGQNEVFMRGCPPARRRARASGSTAAAAQRRDLPRQPVRPAAESQSRHLCGGPQSHRGAGGSARNAVRRRRRGRRHPLHHQRAEARRDRGERQGGLRRDRARRPEHRRDGGVESPADRGHAGAARGDLRRSARRLYQQRACDLHPREHRHRHRVCVLSGGERALPERSASGFRRRLRAARQPDASTTGASWATPSIPSPTRGSGWRRCTRSTKTGTCC